MEAQTTPVRAPRQRLTRYGRPTISALLRGMEAGETLTMGPEYGRKSISGVMWVVSKEAGRQYTTMTVDGGTSVRRIA